MKIVSIIAAILLLTGCPSLIDDSIDPGPSLPTGLDSPDASGNLYVVNQITDTPVLLYTEEGGTLELKKRIPSTGEAFLVDIPNPSGFAKTLKLWKQGDEGSP